LKKYGIKTYTLVNEGVSKLHVSNVKFEFRVIRKMDRFVVCKKFRDVLERYAPTKVSSKWVRTKFLPDFVGNKRVSFTDA